jgi:hypothetical protein
MWAHFCKSEGCTVSVGHGQACSWCGLFQDGSFDYGDEPKPEKPPVYNPPHLWYNASVG